jgi:hypothetical protein
LKEFAIARATERTTPAKIIDGFQQTGFAAGVYSGNKIKPRMRFDIYRC